MGGFAASTLQKEVLDAAIREEWEQFAQLFEADAPGLMGWEREFYNRFTQPGDHILVVGCGNGRDVVPLIQLGRSVVGVDVAPNAVQSCRRLLEAMGLSAAVLAVSAEQVSLDDKFDRVIFSWYCYSYIQGAAARIGALRNAGIHLRPHGQVLLSYLLRRAGDTGARWCALGARVGAVFTGTDWNPEPGDVFLVEGPPPEGLIHYEHRFLPVEVEAEARAAGFGLRFHTQGRHGLAVLELL